VVNGKIIPVQPDLADFLLGISERTREPSWTRDELKFLMDDIVVSESPETLNFSHLNIVPRNIADFAPTILRAYRRPLRFGAA